MLHWSAAMRARKRERRETIVDVSAAQHGGEGAKKLMRSLAD